MRDRVVQAALRSVLEPIFERDFAEAVNSLIQDPARAVNMGKAGRERAVAHFGWDAIAQQTVDVYKAALEG